MEATSQKVGQVSTAVLRTSPPSDRFAWWREALRRFKAGQPVQSMTEAPEYGYYRVRTQKDGPWLSFAVGDGYCYLNGNEANPEDHWLWAAKHPTTYDEYLQYSESGAWPDSVWRAPEMKRLQRQRDKEQEK